MGIHWSHQQLIVDKALWEIVSFIPSKYDWEYKFNNLIFLYFNASIQHWFASLLEACVFALFVFSSCWCATFSFPWVVSGFRCARLAYQCIFSCCSGCSTCLGLRLRLGPSLGEWDWECESACRTPCAGGLFACFCMSCACLFCVSFRFQFLFAGHRCSTLISWVFSVLLFSIFMLAYVLHILLVTFSPVHPHCLQISYRCSLLLCLCLVYCFFQLLFTGTRN